MPTKQQLYQTWATEFEFPSTRRKDDPLYRKPEKTPLMENKLPEHIQKQIDREAQAYMQSSVKLIDDISPSHLKYAYAEGATPWASQCQQMAKALEEILVYCEESGVKRMAVDNPVHMAIYHSLHTAKNALASWKEEGKEGKDGN